MLRRFIALQHRRAWAWPYGATEAEEGRFQGLGRSDVLLRSSDGLCCLCRGEWLWWVGMSEDGSVEMLVKKYSNRRLYDTEESRYITLDELSKKIKSGSDVKVVDAKSGDDLTQATLAQIILESRGAARLLPVPLLTRLIRMEDDALADFMGRYMSWAMEVYLQTKRQAQSMQPYNPFAALPFNATNALAQMLSPWGAPPPMPGQGGYPSPGGVPGGYPSPHPGGVPTPNGVGVAHSGSHEPESEGTPQQQHSSHDPSSELAE
ncbi:MAG: polyhydroxyalkanoate synthesis regulator DNA-binding domain-containing protein, partial [Myxococcota bacterium]